MKTPELHQRLLDDLLAAGAAYPLLVAGADAVRAHGLVERTSRSVTMAVEHPATMADIAAAVSAGLARRGWLVRTSEPDPLSARLVVTEPESGEKCKVDIVKELLWRPPVRTGLGRTLSLEDLIGTRVRALVDRGLAPDLIDVHAAARLRSHPELEELGRRHAVDAFDLADLQSRLTATDWVDDREFARDGLDTPEIAALRRWAQEWADDIGERLLEGEAPEDEE
ncbi:hypothetical protein [Streptomyces sp. TRM68367]|uniref:hypothetical protein n=1 Tax=Streptomyces sp. TRM68367 TaxID=2758415 RepID=UPI00165A24B8|nr:hypothetical protein [Streptomyces sp. TRM68367]MBC9727564.1 hypothetical protein [Streptomyces sp. TRM68367]